MQATIFLDRDGVINHDSAEYIKSPEEFHFIPGSCDAIARLNKNGFQVILITNQSLIGRKMIPQNTLDQIFDKMKKGINDAGGAITDIFFCPHTPDDGCSCRKPETGLIQQAIEKYAIDLGTSCMVGDSTKDILCGKNAGCAKTILVRTGNGESSQLELSTLNRRPDYFAQDLSEAAQWIIGNLKAR